MSTHNIGFYEDLTKIIFELSSNTHLISSADSLINHFVIPAILPLPLNQEEHLSVNGEMMCAKYW